MTTAAADSAERSGSPREAIGRTLAVGDIHGCSRAFDLLLEQLALQAADTLIVLGDVVDRGPDTNGVIERLLRLKSQCQLVLIRGNHEDMFLNGLQGGELQYAWLEHGGVQALDSYGGDPALVPESHLRLLQSAELYWETATHLFVHANLEPGVALARQRPNWLRWTHLTGRETPCSDGRWVICGHTPQLSGWPNVSPGWVCIDTNACRGGWLTALDVHSEEIVQTNQAGDSRRLYLADVPPS